MSIASERQSDAPTQTGRRRGFFSRWLRRLPLMIGLLSLTVWFLPTLIAVTPLRNLILDAAGPQLPKGLEVGSASLSWTGPVELRDVRIPDERGGNLLEVERIESESSLWELATDGLARALFRVFRPKLRLVMRENSTEIDSSVFKLLDRHRSAGRPFALDLENGLILFVDEQGELLTEITDVSLSLDMAPGDTGSEGSLELTGRIVREEAEVEDGSLTIRAEWDNTSAQGPQGRMTLDVTRLPVDALGPLLKSRLDGRTLTGDVTAVLHADWQPDRNALTGALQLDADELTVQLVGAGPDAEVERWEQRGALIRAVGRYHGAGNRASLRELVVESEVVELTASGEIQNLRSDPILDLEGELSSDPEMLLAFLQDLLPEEMRIDDLSVRRFSVSGPLSELTTAFRQSAGGSSRHSDRPSPPLEVRADLEWSAWEAYGIRSDAGLVDAQLAEHELTLVPLQVSLAGGRVETLPRLDLAASPRLFVLDEGLVVRDVQFTSEMSRTWLKYVSPVLADATSIDGRFSILSEGGRMPLAEPRAAVFDGTLAVQSGRVGPGPLARRIIAVADQVRTLFAGAGVDRPQRARNWLELPEQDVSIKIDEGRVHHELMRYRSGDVEILTRGSVGFDESLHVTLEVPLRDEWLEGDRRLAALRGRSLHLPLRGTLTRPRLDAAAVNRLAEQMAAQAGADLLRDLLGQ